MKSNELRIGNLVMCRGAISTITIIQQKSIGYFKNSFVGEDALPLEFVKPVPLTEEWLLNFGFELKRSNKIGIQKSYSKKGNTFNISNSGNIYYGFKNIRIYYVHSLQNLYFALTNEELTLQS